MLGQTKSFAHLCYDRLTTLRRGSTPNIYLSNLQLLNVSPLLGMQDVGKIRVLIDPELKPANFFILGKKVLVEVRETFCVFRWYVIEEMI